MKKLDINVGMIETEVVVTYEDGNKDKKIMTLEEIKNLRKAMMIRRKVRQGF